MAWPFSIFGQTPQVNVIYGDHHIFTIDTPDGWVNDKDLASQIKLVSFFYAQRDAEIAKRSYFYAMGYDKDKLNKDLESFITGDLETFKKKYPDLTYDEVASSGSGGILATRMLSYSNLNDRFKEEVLYMETDSSILVFVYAAMTESDYNDYLPVFDSFISSFNYRGNDPNPYLEWAKTQEK